LAAKRIKFGINRGKGQGDFLRASCEHPTFNVQHSMSNIEHRIINIKTNFLIPVAVATTGVTMNEDGGQMDIGGTFAAKTDFLSRSR
jgi:hypothetical protein